MRLFMSQSVLSVKWRLKINKENGEDKKWAMFMTWNEFLEKSNEIEGFLNKLLWELKTGGKFVKKIKT